MLDQKETLKFQGVYNSLYNATTRPDFKFAVSRYFIDEWVPLLGPSLAWLVVGLRQQCYWNRRRDWCIVDKASLADETALDKRTIERLLKKPLSRWFVLEVTHRYRYSHQLGKKVRDKNRYHLLLDEPLSPRHQLGLMELLRESAPTAPDRLEAALLTLPPLLEQPNLIGKISYTGQIPANLQRLSILEQVEQALDFKLSQFAGDPRAPRLDSYCTRLHNQLVQPNKVSIGWQYFRQRWTPLLGHALAWLIIYVRRHCYWDESNGELRDTYTAYKKELAAAIGQTPRNLANLLENEHLPLFMTILNPQAARNKPTEFRVRMVDEPLTPEDQQTVAQTLQQQLQGELYGHDPESGQLNLFPLLDKLAKRQNFSYGQLSENLPPGSPKKSRFDQTQSEKLPQQAAANNGKFAATTAKDSKIPTDSNIIQKQQKVPVDAESSRGLKILLDDLAVQEPVRSKLLANPDLTIAKIGAWFLYAETQPSLFDPRRYVIKRLLANDPPPPEFLSFARLSDTTWDLFEAVLTNLKIGQLPPEPIPAELEETFVAWAQVYGQFAPEDSRRLLAFARHQPDWAAERAASGDQNNPAAEVDESPGVVLWRQAKRQLKLQMARETFNNWLGQTEALSYKAGRLVIDAKNVYAKDWLENRLLKSIERTLESIVGEPVRVSFVVVEPD